MFGTYHNSGAEIMRLQQAISPAKGEKAMLFWKSMNYLGLVSSVSRFWFVPLWLIAQEHF